ncbi:ABC transporter ATP-binding protein [Nonlabens antarcticus]|uniref:ABC transporter ATP-binding protein n=1 Tax=Nonlabens antarcticus TaxID=392714 RepID=UPI001891A4CA|nr:ATP-binding cassette domain-containing protein [Nonlabens antarcticus]
MLQLDGINFAFAKAETLTNISFQLDQGSHAAIMGESGCGKSTLLNVIYGLLQAQKGTVAWNGDELLGADHHLIPGHPMMKYVPQEFNLMPFTTVTENVGEHLSIQIEHRLDRIMELLEIVEMQDFADRKVKTLSGGQKQRVAIAKALAQEPQLLLLDEPFSHVDNFRKNSLRRRLFHYLKMQNISCLMATHDSGDVLSFTDETIVVQAGKIIDHRETKTLFQDPQTPYIASLFDDVNEIPASWFDTKKDLLLYPYQMGILNSGLEAVVINSYFKGDHFLISCGCKKKNILIKSATDVKAGKRIYVNLV